MVQLKPLDEGVISPSGFRATGISCGLKTGGSKDIALLLSNSPCTAAMAFTRNRIQGSHIVLDKERMNNSIHAILINSGNANCLTGQEGIDNARQMVVLMENGLDIPEGSCLAASTGVIGEPLNMSRIHYGIERLSGLIRTESNIRHFSSSIMNIDSRQKNIAYEFEIGGDKVKIGVSAKGESMVKPWLETMHATLLVFITTDLNISAPLLQRALHDSIEVSFNRITLDTDISPNDSIFLLANGNAGNEIIDDIKDPRFDVFQHVLKKSLEEMVKLLIKHGLGFTKQVYLKVDNATNEAQAEIVARAISESYQVKTALFGQNPPWEKILNVVSYSGVDFDLSTIEIKINDFVLFKHGCVDASAVVAATNQMVPMECDIVVNLNQGPAHSYLWFTDLPHDYVKVNAHFS